MDPSLQMRGQSPMNCPVSDVKMWGQNLTYCLMTKEKAALIHTLMLLLTNTKLQRTFQYTRRLKLKEGMAFYAERQGKARHKTMKTATSSDEQVAVRGK